MKSNVGCHESLNEGNQHITRGNSRARLDILDNVILANRNSNLS